MTRKGKARLLWKSTSIPKHLIQDEEWIWALHAKAIELSLTDVPSTHDLRYALHRYNESIPSQRDAMDSAFVWFTGYTLASLAKMIEIRTK